MISFGSLSVTLSEFPRKIPFLSYTISFENSEISMEFLETFLQHLFHKLSSRAQQFFKRSRSSLKMYTEVSSNIVLRFWNTIRILSELSSKKSSLSFLFLKGRIYGYIIWGDPWEISQRISRGILEGTLEASN